MFETHNSKKMSTINYAKCIVCRQGLMTQKTIKDCIN